MKSVLMALLVLGPSAGALAPENFKGKVQELNFKALNVDRSAQLCESLGLDSAASKNQQDTIYYPVEATLLPTNSGKFLALGSCYKDGAEIKVLTRFFKDSTRDFSYPPEIFKNETFPKQGVSEISFAKSPVGEFFITLGYDTPRTFYDELWERVIFKLDEEGRLDRGFGAGGKLVLDAKKAVKSLADETPGFLKDGTVLDQSCDRGTPHVCTVYNFSAHDGFLLRQKSMEYHPIIRAPFEFNDLNEGLLKEKSLPLCHGINCVTDPIHAVSQGIWSFQDLLERDPVLDPRPTSALSLVSYYFADGILSPFWQPENGRWADTIEFIKFQSAYKRFDLVPEVTGPVRRIKLVQQFSPEIPFVEPVSGMITQIAAELDLNVGRTEPALPSDNNNALECSLNGKFGNGVLVVCLEYDPIQRKSLNYVLVAYDRDMRINRNFADNGYFRPQGICLNDRLESIKLQADRIVIKCNDVTFNGDFSINFARRIFFFE